MVHSAKIINIAEAMELYELMKPHFPKAEVVPTEFVQSMVDKLPADDYVRCVCLLTGTKPDELTEADSIPSLTAFVEGIKINRILTMKSLFERVGV